MNVLVYGFYHSKNLGDNLFCEAFEKLFPEYKFTYTKSITKSNLQNVDAVFFGGGSMLDGMPNITSEAMELLQRKKIFYIGVGTETNIHDTHQQLMRQAKLIASRSTISEQLRAINNNIIQIPDLAYSLRYESPPLKMDNSILILPNAELLPKWSDPHWKHIAWQYFKTQFAQFLDEMVEKNHQISFLSMCSNNTMSDAWAAREIVSMMKNRKASYQFFDEGYDFKEVCPIMSQYGAIITQRFHGIVLSEILNKSYISIHHHDKLKYCSPGRGNFVPYYEISKHKMLDQIGHLNKLDQRLSFDFNELVIKVKSSIK